MLGWKGRDQFERFMTGSLRQLVPDDHALARVDRVLDLSWLQSEVADLYCDTYGLHEPCRSFVADPHPPALGRRALLQDLLALEALEPVREAAERG
jgi:hypothetical protein